MRRAHQIIGWSIAAITTCGLPFAASANDQPVAKTPLPGVSAPQPIVAPKSDDAEKPVPDYGNGFVKMGNWSVKISGYSRVDIATGKISKSDR